jgi:hypothetical protein
MSGRGQKPGLISYNNANYALTRSFENLVSQKSKGSCWAIEIWAIACKVPITLEQRFSSHLYKYYSSRNFCCFGTVIAGHNGLKSCAFIPIISHACTAVLGKLY